MTRNNFAIIELSGKQVKVSESSVFTINQIKDPVGHIISLTPTVLFNSNGSFSTNKGTVRCTVVEHKRAKKINILKVKRRKNSTVRSGHRQNITVMRTQYVGE